MVVCMGDFHERKNAVRNSFNCPTPPRCWARSPVPGHTHTYTHTHPHTHTHSSIYIHIPVILSAQCSVASLHRTPSPATFPGQPALSAPLYTLNKNDFMTLLFLFFIFFFPWPRPNPDKLIYVALLTQQEKAHSTWQKCFWCPAHCCFLIITKCKTELFCPKRPNITQCPEFWAHDLIYRTVNLLEDFLSLYFFCAYSQF